MPRVCLLAGPGTGKSKTIEKRVVHLLNTGVLADRIYVISFTRATCTELKQRIQAACANQPCAGFAKDVWVSTMHSLALRILRRANLLTAYPSTPIMLDSWEQRCIYDQELAGHLGCKPSRATEIRLGHDAEWQTLSPAAIAQAQITQAEVAGFTSFHSTRTHLYSCVLPGEVIHRCVRALQQNALMPTQLPAIDHLIVDEFQDLNACDQEFVRLLCSGNTVLFVAGDDDQSIYSFRHANPDGIVQFASTYTGASTHILTDCFRCTPAILDASTHLIEHNPNRIPKSVASVYAASDPPVPGQVLEWAFLSPLAEAQAVAESCQALVNVGMAEREDEIVILICNRRVQLPLLEQELKNRNLPYEPPRGAGFVDDHESIRAIYSILRILQDIASGDHDYLAYRDLLQLLSGVGAKTAKGVGDACLQNNQNYRDLFHLGTPPAWLTKRPAAAVQRVMAVVQGIAGWNLADTVAARTNDVATLLSTQVFAAGQNAVQHIEIWTALANALPPEMMLEELLAFLAADTEAEQEVILTAVVTRIGASQQPAPPPQAAAGSPKKIRVLTMHGAKGLSGSVVFIPSAEQGIMPSFKALNATGLLVEQRRLFYVSVTRAKACCIVSRTQERTGATALALVQKPKASLARSQFVSEMGLTTVWRNSGMTSMEATAIVNQVNNL
ncbi:MAG: ATP-dependent helicase [Sedimentisphaerales bacterium]|nr:ATP-dependent helicase [Sedimentisphaerales bacterium]